MHRMCAMVEILWFFFPPKGMLVGGVSILRFLLKNQELGFWSLKVI